jgi:hypothetical protein
VWVVRGDHRYYYRVRRVGGRVVKTYVGTGPAAEAAAAADERRRAENRRRAIERARATARWSDAWARFQGLVAAARLLESAALLAAGFHRPFRGRWRPRRGRSPMPVTTTPPADPAEDVNERLAVLTPLARAGDVAAAAEIGRVLDRHPELWRRCGDLARQVRVSLADFAADSDPIQFGCIDRSLVELERELEQPGSGPLDRLLVGRVVAAHVLAQIADARVVASQTRTAADRRDAEKQAAAAQYALVQAVKALANLRTLARRSPSPLDLLGFGQDRAAAGMPARMARVG